MKHHLAYLRYILRHKWFVFVAGRRTGVSLWRLLAHDLSKFSRAEWAPYVDSFYRRPNRPEWVRAAFDAAWLHHQHHNPHHWQSWILREDSGATKALVMPEPLAREMVADWMGAGRAITGRWDVVNWYEKNRATIVLHSETRALVDRLIAEVG